MTVGKSVVLDHDPNSEVGGSGVTGWVCGGIAGWGGGGGQAEEYRGEYRINFVPAILQVLYLIMPCPQCLYLPF